MSLAYNNPNITAQQYIDPVTGKWVGYVVPINIRAISDYGKSELQLYAELVQEVKHLCYIMLPMKGDPSFEYTLAHIDELLVPGTFFSNWRRIYTHEQVMAGRCIMPKGKVLSFKETLGPVFHIIAGVIAYVPGLGTAVAFVLNAATSLAEGAPISDVVLEAVKGALPGQPASSMAFDAAVAIARGEPIENVGIAALPIDEESKGYLKQATHVIRGLAEGQPVTSVALDAIYEQLPPEGQRAIELAHRAMNGESIGNLALEESARAAKSAGEQTANQFMAQVGYAELMDRVPSDIKYAVESANVLIQAGKIQSGQTAVTPPAPVALGRIEVGAVRQKNDALAAAGLQLSKTNPRIGIHRLSPPSYIKDVPAWTRGFDVGIAAAQGLVGESPELNKTRLGLGSVPAMGGFNAAIQLQFSITSTHLQSILQGINTMPALGLRILSAADRAMFVKAAADGIVMAQNNPQILAARNLNADPRYKWGFDIATSVCVGMSLPGPGQSAIRTKLGPFSPGGGPGLGEIGSNVAMQGFDVGQALQFGITKALASGVAQNANASVAAGNLATSGMAGTALSADTKASTMSVLASNPLTRQGAQTAIAQVAAEQNKGFFTKILEFFGLA